MFKKKFESNTYIYIANVYYLAKDGTEFDKNYSFTRLEDALYFKKELESKREASTSAKYLRIGVLLEDLRIFGISLKKRNTFTGKEILL